MPNVPTVPKGLIELGVTVVIVFLVVLVVWLILQIIKAVRKPAVATELFLDGQRRAPCIQAPMIQSMASNQAVTVEAIKEIRTSIQESTKNLVIQTELLKRVAVVQEDIGKCMTRMEVRDEQGG